VNALPATAEAGLAPDPYENNDGIVYWDIRAQRWLPLPVHLRRLPPEPDPADMVAVMFTRAEVVALFGLLQWANQWSLGLAVQAGVRDTWVRLSLAYGQSRPALDLQFAETTTSSTTSERQHHDRALPRPVLPGLRRQPGICHRLGPQTHLRRSLGSRQGCGRS